MIYDLPASAGSKRTENKKRLDSKHPHSKTNDKTGA
jgi:hypothetical protein